MTFWHQIKNKIGKTRDLVALGSSDLIGNGITSILWLYIASISHTANYGELQLIISIAGTAYLFSLFATPTVMTVYASKNFKLDSTLTFITLLGTLVSATVVSLLFSRIDIGFLVLGFVMNDLATSYLIGKKEYSKYTKYVISQKSISLILCILLYQKFGNAGVIYGLTISYLPFVKIIYAIFKETKINFAEIKSRIGFIINNYLISLASVFRSQLDKILIGSVFGFSLLGNYALASQIYAIFMILPNILTKFLLPEEARGKSSKRFKKYTMIIGILISLFGILILPQIIPIAFPAYTDTIEIIKITSLGIIPATLSLILSTELLGMEKSKHVLIARWIWAGTVIGGIFFLGQFYGILGLSSALVLSTVFYDIYLLIVKFYTGRKLV
jgi:O-antigen/teichoic acid export membrane protein